MKKRHIIILHLDKKEIKREMGEQRCELSFPSLLHTCNIPTESWGVTSTKDQEGNRIRFEADNLNQRK